MISLGLNFNISLAIFNVFVHLIVKLSSLTMHPDKVRIATGQVGKSPQILVWNSKNLQTVSIMKGVHTDGVGILAFDKTGNVCIVLSSKKKASF